MIVVFQWVAIGIHKCFIPNCFEGTQHGNTEQPKMLLLQMEAG